MDFDSKFVAMVLPLIPVAVAECVASGACVVLATGVVRVCATAVSAIRQLQLLGRLYQVYDCVANGTCAATAPTPETLTAGHEATNRDRTKVGYGGQCKPDQYDDLEGKKKEACDAAAAKGGCRIGEINLDKADAFKNCASARENVANTCFLGGDTGHLTAIAQALRAAEKCTIGK
jgi:Novel toxin 16